MAARTPLPAKSTDSSLVTGLIFTVLVLVAALIVGGYWMQKQRGESAERMQANAYQNYLNNTRPTPMPQRPKRLRCAASRRRRKKHGNTCWATLR